MQDNVPDTVSVAEAAAALGISTDAVRKRLLRGTIDGEKVNGAWRVIMPADAPDTNTPPADTPPVHSPDNGALATAFAQLAAENARNAAAAAMWQERARNLETQLLALQPGDPPENEAQNRPVSDDSAHTGINTHADSLEPQQSRWGRFLGWLRGE